MVVSFRWRNNIPDTTTHFVVTKRHTLSHSIQAHTFDIRLHKTVSLKTTNCVAVKNATHLTSGSRLCLYHIYHCTIKHKPGSGSEHWLDAQISYHFGTSYKHILRYKLIFVDCLVCIILIWDKGSIDVDFYMQYTTENSVLISFVKTNVLKISKYNISAIWAIKFVSKHIQSWKSYNKLCWLFIFVFFLCVYYLNRTIVVNTPFIDTTIHWRDLVTEKDVSCPSIPFYLTLTPWHVTILHHCLQNVFEIFIRPHCGSSTTWSTG